MGVFLERFEAKSESSSSMQRRRELLKARNGAIGCGQSLRGRIRYVLLEATRSSLFIDAAMITGAQCGLSGPFIILTWLILGQGSTLIR